MQIGAETTFDAEGDLICHTSIRLCLPAILGGFSTPWRGIFQWRLDGKSLAKVFVCFFVGRGKVGGSCERAGELYGNTFLRRERRERERERERERGKTVERAKERVERDRERERERKR